MGALSHGRCFGTVVEAAQAECGSYPRASVDSAGVTTWSCTAVAPDGSALSLARSDATGAQTAAVVAVSFPPCDESEPYTDAATLWSAGIAAVVAVYCARAFVLRFVENH